MEADNTTIPSSQDSALLASHANMNTTCEPERTTSVPSLDGMAELELRRVYGEMGVTVDRVVRAWEERGTPEEERQRLVAVVRAQPVEALAVLKEQDLPPNPVFPPDLQRDFEERMLAAEKRIKMEIALEDRARWRERKCGTQPMLTEHNTDTTNESAGPSTVRSPAWGSTGAIPKATKSLKNDSAKVGVSSMVRDCMGVSTPTNGMSSPDELPPSAGINVSSPIYSLHGSRRRLPSNSPDRTGGGSLATLSGSTAADAQRHPMDTIGGSGGGEGCGPLRFVRHPTPSAPRSTSACNRAGDASERASRVWSAARTRRRRNHKKKTETAPVESILPDNGIQTGTPSRTTGLAQCEHVSQTDASCILAVNVEQNLVTNETTSQSKPKRLKGFCRAGSVGRARIDNVRAKADLHHVVEPGENNSTDSSNSQLTAMAPDTADFGATSSHSGDSIFTNCPPTQCTENTSFKKIVSGIKKKLSKVFSTSRFSHHQTSVDASQHDPHTTYPASDIESEQRNHPPSYPAKGDKWLYTSSPWKSIAQYYEAQCTPKQNNKYCIKTSPNTANRCPLQMFLNEPSNYSQQPMHKNSTLDKRVKNKCVVLTPIPLTKPAHEHNPTAVKKRRKKKKARSKCLKSVPIHENMLLGADKSHMKYKIETTLTDRENAQTEKTNPENKVLESTDKKATLPQVVLLQPHRLSTAAASNKKLRIAIVKAYGKHVLQSKAKRTSVPKAVCTAKNKTVSAINDKILERPMNSETADITTHMMEQLPSEGAVHQLKAESAKVSCGNKQSLNWLEKPSDENSNPLNVTGRGFFMPDDGDGLDSELGRNTINELSLNNNNENVTLTRSVEVVPVLRDHETAFQFDQDNTENSMLPIYTDTSSSRQRVTNSDVSYSTQAYHQCEEGKQSGNIYLFQPSLKNNIHSKSPNTSGFVTRERYPSKWRWSKEIPKQCGVSIYTENELQSGLSNGPACYRGPMYKITRERRKNHGGLISPLRGEFNAHYNRDEGEVSTAMWDTSSGQEGRSPSIVAEKGSDVSATADGESRKNMSDGSSSRLLTSSQRENVSCSGDMPQATHQCLSLTPPLSTLPGGIYGVNNQCNPSSGNRPGWLNDALLAQCWEYNDPCWSLGYQQQPNQSIKEPATPPQSFDRQENEYTLPPFSCNKRSHDPVNPCWSSQDDRLCRCSRCSNVRSNRIRCHCGGVFRSNMKGLLSNQCTGKYSLLYNLNLPTPNTVRTATSDDRKDRQRLSSHRNPSENPQNDTDHRRLCETAESFSRHRSDILKLESPFTTNTACTNFSRHAEQRKHDFKGPSRSPIYSQRAHQLKKHCKRSHKQTHRRSRSRGCHEGGEWCNHVPSHCQSSTQATNIESSMSKSSRVELNVQNPETFISTDRHTNLRSCDTDPGNTPAIPCCHACWSSHKWCRKYLCSDSCNSGFPRLTNQSTHPAPQQSSSRICEETDQHLPVGECEIFQKNLAQSTKANRSSCSSCENLAPSAQKKSDHVSPSDTESCQVCCAASQSDIDATGECGAENGRIHSHNRYQTEIRHRSHSRPRSRSRRCSRAHNRNRCRYPSNLNSNQRRDSNRVPPYHGHDDLPRSYSQCHLQDSCKPKNTRLERCESHHQSPHFDYCFPGAHETSQYETRNYSCTDLQLPSNNLICPISCNEPCYDCPQCQGRDVQAHVTVSAESVEIPEEADSFDNPPAR